MFGRQSQPQACALASTRPDSGGVLPSGRAVGAVRALAVKPVLPLQLLLELAIAIASHNSHIHVYYMTFLARVSNNADRPLSMGVHHRNSLLRSVVLLAFL